MLGARPAWRSIALLALMALGAAPQKVAAPAAPAPPLATRAFIVVRTLVMDPMGTRTVSTDRARVPFGTRGLLVRSVPYAGPPLSFRLAARPAAPTADGISLVLEADVWSGDSSNPPPAEALAHRSEQTTLSAEGSYLLELDHDDVARRRVVLSITARPIGEGDEIPPDPPLSQARGVDLYIQIIRQAGPQADEPITHSLATVMGRSVSYSLTVRAAGTPRGQAGTTVGGTLVVTPESWQGDLITVKTQLDGAEYLDAARSHAEPFHLAEVRTVAAGKPIDLNLTVPPAGTPIPEGGRQVTYSIIIVPTLN